jgi:succinyl-diaminopimelate desuccinylase
MIDRISERALSRVDEGEVVDLCRRLIQIRSIDPPGNELEAALFVADYLGRAGLKADLVEHGPGRASVFATLKGSGERPGLVFSAHLDVVPVGAEKWQRDPFGGELAEGKIWGRGASDMKSGLAAMLVAARALAEAGLGLKGDLHLVLTAGEETGLTGAHQLASRPELKRVGAILVGEPSSNQLVIAEKGALWVELSTYGKTAHGSMPDQGRNALTMMLALLGGVERMEVDFKVHPLLGVFTRSINTINAGITTNVVPDRCVATVDMRTVPGQDHDAILRQIQGLMDDLKGDDPGFEATCRVLSDYPPLATEPDSSLVKDFLEVLEQVSGVPHEPRAVRYYTDAAALVPALNVPMVICGPGVAELAHQPNEYVEVSRLGEAARIYTLFAARQLGRLP